MEKKGLRVGDLRNLIVPECTIDRIKPKISDDNIVIVFFIERSTEDAAYDLSSFIEKCPWDDVLDTEVGEVPNADGRYEIFVEVPRQPNFVEEFLLLLKDICTLGDMEEKDWKFLPLGNEQYLPLNKKSLSIINSNELKESFSEFQHFDNVDGNIITLGNHRYIMETVKLEGSINVYETLETSHLEQCLGNGYSVGQLDSGKLILESSINSSSGIFLTLDKVLL